MAQTLTYQRTERVRMGAIHTAAKVAFWLGIVFAITTPIGMAIGNSTLVGSVLVVIPLVSPYLYLMFAEGRAEARGPAEPAE